MISWWSEEANFVSPFGLHHFIYISIVVVALAALLLNRGQVRAKASGIGTIILLVSIIQQIVLYSWYFIETGFNISESLPLHICRISSLLGIYFLLTKNTKALDIMFFFGLYAYGSFLYPQRIYPVDHVIGISFVINHAVTILLPYFGYIAYNWRPKFKGLLRAYFFFVLYIAFVYILNPLIDGNYFYLKYRPFFREWPDSIYIAGVLFVTFCGYLIAYAVVNSFAKGKNKVDNFSPESPSSRAE
ncbi:TIGR02206 family membrane protein [Virgibacillus necropolis]|uniref:TMEM164-related integral membrane acyltransferase n=1 Tax=Virgibacillus necropolis TaxID=163877 RepID=UPI00384C6923